MGGAVEEALAKNPVVEKAALAVKKARLAYDRISLEVREMEEYGVAMPYEFHLARHEVDRAGNMAAMYEKFSRNKLALDVQQDYLGLLKAYDGLGLAQLGLERALEQKRLAEAAFSAGTVARSDVLGAEAQVAGAEAQLFAAESALAIAEMTLNKTLGRELDLTLPIDKNFNPPEIGHIDLAEGLEAAMEHNIEMVEARENLDLQEKVFRVAKSFYTPNVFLYREAELNLAEARLNVKVAEDNVRLQVSQLYAALGGMEKQEAALEKSVSYAAESYRLAQLRYEAGIATQMDVLGALVTLSEMENRLLQARYDHYLTYLQWLFVTGRPVQW